MATAGKSTAAAKHASSDGDNDVWQHVSVDSRDVVASFGAASMGRAAPVAPWGEAGVPAGRSRFRLPRAYAVC